MNTRSAMSQIYKLDNPPKYIINHRSMSSLTAPKFGFVVVTASMAHCFLSLEPVPESVMDLVDILWLIIFLEEKELDGGS